MCSLMETGESIMRWSPLIPSLPGVLVAPGNPSRPPWPLQQLALCGVQDLKIVRMKEPSLLVLEIKKLNTWIVNACYKYGLSFLLHSVVIFSFLS